MHSAKSPTSLQTDTIYQYFIENCKIFTAHATITDVSTDGYNLSVFYRELQNIYYTCHNHQCLYRRIQSVDISQRAGLFSSMSVQFIITNGLCKFQNIGINASLTACIYRRTVSVSRNVGDCALCMTNYVCIAYLSSCNVTFPYPG